MDFKQNINQLMQEALKIQERMKETEQELSHLSVVGQAGGGDKKVDITMNGRHDVTKVAIAPSLVNESLPVLEDLIAAAINDAVRKIEKISRDRIATLTSGLNIPKDIMGGGDKA